MKKRKILTMFLATVLMIAGVPWTSLTASAHTTLDPTNKVSDASTLDGWETYFGENAKIDDNTTGYTTEYAGGVWTDKSVFKEGTTIDGQTIGLTDNENFLVTLSTMSSTKQIKGYSYLPTDTVFVLDTSGSMTDDDIKAMVEATNAAITKLYETNNYNRVGIAVYNLNSYTLMPIDRYIASADSENPYIIYSKSEDVRSISVTNGVKRSNGVAYSNKVDGRSGTYTQGGMQEGLSLFLDVTDTSIETGNIQGGTKRIPVMVLMTDGDPTSGASNYLLPLENGKTPNSYRDIGKDDYASTTNELVFLTQLTAANIHNQMEAHYGRDCLFYTLGLGVSGGYAVQMLEPATKGTDSAEKIDELWRKYSTTAQGREVCKYSGTYNRQTLTVSIKRVADATQGDKLVENRYYTDKYFSASNTDGLITAFEDIVQEIILQSKYYPTLVTTGKQDLDGYVTIVDELGEKMEVKDVKGLLYGNTMFTGEALLQAMANGEYGNRNQWTEYGWELVESIRERLEVAATGDNTVGGNDNTGYGNPITVTNDVVIELLKEAWADGQISYTGSANNITSFSNYISYYVNAKGQYLGFHDKDHTAQSYPTGTRYIGKSYLFQGKISDTSTGSLSGGEMMHVVLQVYEDVTNGNQTVTWRVPASMVPLAIYEIGVNGTELTATNLTSLSYTADTPLRAIYEVGLTEELTPLNVKEVMEAGHHHDAPNGGYYFYSNRWGELEGDDTITELDPRNHKATVAHYEPSAENERYYFVEDSIIYQKQADGSYVAYEGNNRPSGNGFYHAIKVVTKTSAGSPVLTEKWLEISADVLSDTEATQKVADNSNNWYVKKGTIYKHTGRDQVKKKDTEITNTLEYVDYPVIEHPADNVPDYDIYMFLGNNGRFEVKPAQGLKLTKLVENVVPGTNADNFVFDITFGSEITPEQTNAIMVTDGEYNKITSNVTITEEKVTVTLAKDQTVYITGIPTGTTYTITEQNHDDYKLSSITNGGSGTVTANTIAEFVATNVEKPNTGNLVVTKLIHHSYGDSYAIPDNTVFEIKVNLGNAFADRTLTNVVSESGVYLDGTQNVGQSITSATADANGVFTFIFGHMDDVTFYNLPEGTEYGVTETIPSTATGWKNQITYDEQEHKIVAEETHNIDVKNTYDPSYSTQIDISVEVTKNLDGITWEGLEAGAKFEFQIEKYNAESKSWNEVSLTNGASFEISKVENATQPTKVTLSKEQLNILANEVGTHYYRISEKTGNLSGITYDATHAYFRVIVTDNNLMDEKFEYTIEAANNATLYGNTIKATFTNRYNSTTANINIKKILENNTGVDVAMDSFEFVLCENADCTKDDSCVQKDKHIAVKPNVNGDVIIPMTYEAWNPQIDYTVVQDEEVKEYTKTYVYYLFEKPTGIAGMLCLTNQVQVTVTITEEVKITKDDSTNQGSYTVTKLTSTVKYEYNDEVVAESDTDATFKNRYELASTTATISGTKTFAGRDMRTGENAESFVIELYKADSDYKIVATDGYPKIKTLTGLKDGISGDFAFEETFDRAGIYHYIVKEQIPADKKGITYDESEYRVEIVVTPHNSEAALVSTVNTLKAGGGANSIAFTNTYSITGSTKATLDVTKVLTGRDLKEDEFKFSLYKADSEYNTVDNDGNTENGTTPIDGNIGHYANTGKLKLPELQYTAPGTYYYVLKENIPSEAEKLGGVTYDEKSIDISVTVSDNGVGGLVIGENDITYTGDAKFTNTYETSPADKVIITGEKFYVDESNQQLELKGGEFKFGLHETDDNYVIDLAKDVKHTTNGANGLAVDQFAFELNFDKKGTYYYVIHEELGDSPTIIYDTTIYRVMVVVLDNGSGKLNTLVNVTDVNGNHVNFTYGDTKEFKNIEKTVTPIEVPFNIKKTIVKTGNADHTLSGFEFEIKNVTTGEVYSKKPVSDKNGDALFNVQYTKADIGKTYTYEIREINAGKKNMTYDDTVYTVDVTVEYVGNELVATVKLNEQIVENVLLEFENTYSGKLPKPDPIIDPGEDVTVSETPEYYPAPQQPTQGGGSATGDSANIATFVALACVAVLGLSGITIYKRKKN